MKCPEITTYAKTAQVMCVKVLSFGTLEWSIHNWWKIDSLKKLTKNWFSVYSSDEFTTNYVFTFLKQVFTSKKENGPIFLCSTVKLMFWCFEDM